MTDKEITKRNTDYMLKHIKKGGDMKAKVDLAKLELDSLFQKSDIEHDPVSHPKHYTSHPSGIECIAITRHMNFNLGNVMKYIWRTDDKNGVEDLQKAFWYLRDEIVRLGGKIPE